MIDNMTSSGLTQRFEHVMICSYVKDLERLVQKYERDGWELITVFNVGLPDSTLRELWWRRPVGEMAGRDSNDG